MWYQASPKVTLNHLTRSLKTFDPANKLYTIKYGECQSAMF